MPAQRHLDLIYGTRRLISSENNKHQIKIGRNI